MARYKPGDAAQLRDLVAWAVAEESPLEIFGGGSKAEIGRPMQSAHSVDLSGFAGILDYQPAELVLTAGAATPLAEIEALLAAQSQMLAFEPPDWRALLRGGDRPAGAESADQGTKGAIQTLGGVLAGGLAGSRRFKAGAARDHFLGFAGVTGRGEIFKAGGKVVKNVTGYDLPKLMAGSWGTLAALTEVTVKVLPRPEKTRTVLILGLDEAAAVAVMAEALRTPHEVSGAAFLPAALGEASMLAQVRDCGASVLALRLEGHAPSVKHRGGALRADLSAIGPSEELSTADSLVLWREISDVALFDASLPQEAGRAVWRASLTPSEAPAFIEAVRERLDCRYFLDWAGGLVWLSVTGQGDAGAALLRGALAGSGGKGHLTLIRASRSVRSSVPVFEPQDAALSALTRRVKDAFDPKHILNPGRMYEGC